MEHLKRKLTDELVALREQARTNKEWTLSDYIRDILDERGSFVFDGPEGQIVYHLGKGYTRDQVKQELTQWDQKFK